MVVTLNSARELNKDDGQIPVNNISYAHFWAALDPSKPVPPEFHPDLYTGDFVDSLPSPPPKFDITRPHNLPLNRFNKDGILLLEVRDPPIVYEFCSHKFYERHRIITYAGETWEVSHVAAALAADPLTDVLVLTNPNIPIIQLADIILTYKNAILLQTYDGELDYEKLKDVDSRVQTVTCSGPDESEAIRKALCPAKGHIGRPVWHDLSGQDEMEKKTDLWTYTNAHGGRAEYVSVGVVGSTYIVAKAFQRLGAKDFYALMRARLILPDPLLTLPAILAWAADPQQTSPAALLLKMPPLSVLLVWSRCSGQNTEDGYNPAGDSDFKGQLQLLDTVDVCKPEIVWTVTIGDDPVVGLMPRGKLHLGEFWTNPTTPFFMKGRAGQMAFFVALRSRHDVVQIGQRTDGMDIAALVGIPTVSIDDLWSPNRKRMQKWEEVMTKRYCCAITGFPPTPLGKALRDPAINESDSPEQQRADAKSLLLSNPTKFPAGYINTDWYTITVPLQKVWDNRKTSEADLSHPIPEDEDGI